MAPRVTSGLTMDIRLRLQQLADALPEDGSVVLTRARLVEWLAGETAVAPLQEVPSAPEVEPTWRERLWTAPAEVRIGTQEVAEALGKPVSWVYRHTSGKSGYTLLPHRKLDGELLFVVGEIRAWVRDHEQVGHAARMDSTAAERGAHLRKAG